jgi:hypothetical protein
VVLIGLHLRIVVVVVVVCQLAEKQILSFESVFVKLGKFLEGISGQIKKQRRKGLSRGSTAVFADGVVCLS